MKRTLITALTALMLTLTVSGIAEAKTSCRTECVTVKGYVNSHGTTVASYQRNYPVTVYQHDNDSTSDYMRTIHLSKAGRYMWYPACHCWKLRFRPTNVNGVDKVEPDDVAGEDDPDDTPVYVPPAPAAIDEGTLDCHSQATLARARGIVAQYPGVYTYPGAVESLAKALDPWFGMPWIGTCP